MAATLAETVFSVLSTSRVFKAAPIADLERLASRCGCERYRRGAEIPRRGTTAEGLAVLGRGRVKGTFPSPGSEGEFVVAMYWPGDVFGEISVFDRQTMTGSSVAVTETEVVIVPRGELLSLLERRPAVAICLVETLCEKLRLALDLSLSMRFLDIPSRFYQKLVYLGRFDSRREGMAVRIQHGLSQQELADSIGASREALNKVISEWKRAGLLEWGRGFVVIRDPATLARLLPVTIRHLPTFGVSPLESVEPRALVDDWSTFRRP